MNLRTHRSSLATLLLVSLLWATSTNAATTNAVIRTIRGTVTYDSAGETDKQAKVGKRLEPGSSIKTQGAESQADLFLNKNGPIVRVRPDTELFIEKLDYQDTGVETVIATRLKLIKGRILGNVKKMSTDSTYEVVFPRGVMKVRGTDYDVSADGRTACISGAVDVTYFRRNGRILAQCRLIEGQSTEYPRSNRSPQKAVIRASAPDQNGIRKSKKEAMKAALWASNQRSQAAEERTTNAMIIPAHLRTLGALLLVSMLWTQTINAATNQAIIRLKRGTVTYLSAAQTANEAKFGKRLEAGSSIQTKGTESTADLFLKQNGPIVRVRPDTELFIQQLDYEEMDKETVVTTRLRLIHGAVRLLVLKLHNLSCYTVYFPGGEMRTSGGEFEISSTGEVTAVTGQLFVQFNQAEKVSAKGYILSSGYSASKDGVRKLNPADSADQSLLISDFIGCIGPPLPAMPLFSEPNFPRRKGL